MMVASELRRLFSPLPSSVALVTLTPVSPGLRRLQCHLSLSVDNAFDVPAVLPGCQQGSLNTLQYDHYFVLLLPQQVEEKDKLGRIVTKSVIG